MNFLRSIHDPAIVLLAILFCHPAVAQTKPSSPTNILRAPVFEELDGNGQARLGRVEALIQGGQVEEAIDVLRRVIDGDGDKIVRGNRPPNLLPAGFMQFITAREFGLAKLAELQQSSPQEFLAYRRQIEPVADRWLDEGLTTRDEKKLRRLVQEMFLSKAGDQALLALGELALERGEYNAARSYWERIHATLRFPPSDQPAFQNASDQPLWMSLRGVDLRQSWPVLAPLLKKPQPRVVGRGADQQGREPSRQQSVGRLVYPDTDLNLAEVRARLALVSIMEGNVERASIEVGILRQLDGGAEGTIAGRQGRLVNLLESYLAESRKWPERGPPSDWSTFAGNSARQHMARVELTDVSKPLWSRKLPRLGYQQELFSLNRARVGEHSDGILSYHPLVHGRHVIVQGGYRRNQVAVCDIDTGELLFPSAFSAAADESQESGRGIFGVPRFTATMAEDRLYVRTGIPLSVAPSSRGRISMPARIEALDLAADGKLLWTFASEAPAWGADWTLGGPPVTEGDQLYIVLIRRGPMRVETHLAALDLLDGRVRWRRFLCAAEPACEDNISLFSQTLLSLNQGVVYCNTNQGAVAACDSQTGSVLWLTAYPRTPIAGTDPDRNDLHFYRDLNPCLVFQDLVLVAPTDCNRLFALDANTGAPIWVSRAEVGADVVHFLGVGGNNLIASGECLYWFDVYSGRLVGQYPGPFLPAPGFARPSPRGYGRGVLVGQHVYWPTHDAILVFEQRTVRGERGWEPVPVREMSLADSGATGGNLVTANGVLLIAGADHLTAFRTLAKP